MQEKIVKTLMVGRTKVNILEPVPAKDEAELKERNERLRRAAWQLWCSLTHDQQVRLNEISEARMMGKS